MTIVTVKREFFYNCPARTPYGEGRPSCRESKGYNTVDEALCALSEHLRAQHVRDVTFFRDTDQ